MELNDTNVFCFKKYQANRINLLFVCADSLLTNNCLEKYAKRPKIMHTSIDLNKSAINRF